MPAIPTTKLFDFRQGNNSIDSDTTVYPRATLMVFRDNAAKQNVIAAFALLGSYSATIPDPNNPGQTIANPQSEQAFFMAELTAFVNGKVREARHRTAAIAAANNVTETDLP